MGFFFRKSASFGPLRLNLSKSGIGLSAGVKGFRITSSARGLNYYTVGGNGFYYRETLGKPHPHGNRTVPGPVGSTTSPQDAGEFATADPAQLIASSTERLINDLTDRSQRTNPALLLYGLAALGLIVGLSNAQSSSLIAFSWLLATLVGGLGSCLHVRHNRERQTVLTYELDGPDSTGHGLAQQAITHLHGCQRMWRILDATETWDSRRNAGAGILITRSSATAGSVSIPHVNSNVPVAGILMGDTRLYFLPDVVLYYHSGRFGAIQYEDLRMVSGETRYIETEGVPSDSTQIGTTWRFARVDGGPDRRFNNNRPIPVLQYGTIQISAAQGLNIHLYASSPQKARLFVETMTQRCSYMSAPPNGQQNGRPRDENSQSARPRHDSDYYGALKVLELDGMPRLDEVTASYRRLATMYHPDKVAGLGREFQILADQKMKELNAAYALLKTRLR